MLKKRVVITGLGLVTPIGIGVDNFWKSCWQGQSGSRPISPSGNRDPSVPLVSAVKNFDPAQFIFSGKPERMDPFAHYALAASSLALRDASINLEHQNLQKIGVILGTSLGGMTVAEEQMEKLQINGPKKVHPKLVPANTLNAAAGEVAIAYGLKGANLTVSTPFVSGAVAIGLAYDSFQFCELDIILAGGVDVPLPHLTSMSIMRDDIVSLNATKPFDRNRDGFVIGEGCGILALERLEHALERGAFIYAEYGGYAQTHSTSAQKVKNRISAIELALESASLSKKDVDFIHAHGTATQEGDLLETQAIKALFGSRAYKIPISATKSMLGHTIGAAGAIELAVCALAIRDSLIPPTINYEEPDPECDLDYVPNKARELKVKNTLSNCFGHKGDNIVSVLKHYTLGQ